MASTAAPTGTVGRPTGTTRSTAPPPSSTGTERSADGNCTTKLGSLTRRQRLGQLLMLGVDGDAGSDSLRSTQESGIGSLFVRGNATSGFIDGSFAALSGSTLPPLVAVDEEGGRVQRIDDLAGPMPSARVMATTLSPDQVRSLAKARGHALGEFGVTVDFAPTVDVSDQPDDGAIGDRSYSTDPAAVTTYAGAFADGLRSAGILPVLKHFPGHGSAIGDSHQGASVTPPWPRMVDDLRPYRALVPAGTNPGVAVMVGHLDVPGLTDGVPASLSPAAYRVLRDELAFDGVIFTDDLSGMRAITSRYNTRESVIRALSAGADVALLVSEADPAGLLGSLESAVESGDLPASRVDESAARVLRAKGCPG